MVSSECSVRLSFAIATISTNLMSDDSKDKGCAVQKDAGVSGKKKSKHIPQLLRSLILDSLQGSTCLVTRGTRSGRKTSASPVSLIKNGNERKQSSRA